MATVAATVAAMAAVAMAMAVAMAVAAMPMAAAVAMAVAAMPMAAAVAMPRWPRRCGGDDCGGEGDGGGINGHHFVRGDAIVTDSEACAGCSAAKFLESVGEVVRYKLTRRGHV